MPFIPAEKLTYLICWFGSAPQFESSATVMQIISVLEELLMSLGRRTPSKLRASEVFDALVPHYDFTLWVPEGVFDLLELCSQIQHLKGRELTLVQIIEDHRRNPSRIETNLEPLINALPRWIKERTSRQVSSVPYQAFFRDARNLWFTYVTTQPQPAVPSSLPTVLHSMFSCGCDVCCAGSNILTSYQEEGIWKLGGLETAGVEHLREKVQPDLGMVIVDAFSNHMVCCYSFA